MWPPIWMGYAATTGKSARDEVGRLKEVRCYLQNPSRIFLIVDYEGFEFTGCLLFDDAVACEQMAYFFEKCCGLLIEDIGSLELPLSINSGLTYRKVSDHQTWHFSKDCSHWPETAYEELDELPEMAQLCNECRNVARIKSANSTDREART